MEFQNKYRNDGLAAIGASMDEDGWKSVKPFPEENKLNYPVVIANQDLSNPYGGLPSLPMALLIDRNGRIAESHAGMVNKDELEIRSRRSFTRARLSNIEASDGKWRINHVANDDEGCSAHVELGQVQDRLFS